MKNSFLKDLTIEKCKTISAGDGITEAVFWIFNKYIKSMERELDRSGGPTAIHG